ncbi:MAG TPA: tetratricopeptide repeat protein, partial [Azospirillum sp.]
GDGRPDTLLRRAIALRPDLTEAHVNLSALYAAARRADETVAAATAGLEAAPGHPALLRDRGIGLALLGRDDSALRPLRASACMEPADPRTWHWLGQASPSPGQREVALGRAWRLTPDNGDTARALIALFTERWRWGLADKILRRLLCGDPRDLDLVTRLARLRIDRGQTASGLVWAGRATALDPSDATARVAAGNALLALDRIDEAESAMRRAAALRPDHAASSINIAAIMVERRVWPEAERLIRRALRVDPDDGAAHYSLGVALKNLGRLDESLAAYEEGVRRRPESPRERFNRALALLTAGRTESGLAEYEWRWRMPDFPSVRHLHPRPTLPPPVWTGEPLAGRTIVLWGEQGIGDEICDGGFVPPVVAAAGTCVIEVEHRLVPLFQRSFPGAVVVPRTTPPHPRAAGADLQCPMGSLALRTGATRAVAGYLTADPERTRDLRDRYRRRAGPVVGIAWRSRKPRGQRSFAAALEHWEPILTQPGITLVSLQYGPVDEDVAWARRRFGADILIDSSVDALRDLDAFAAQVAACDVVVSIANATVPMAHALGRPALAVLRHDQDDWRYADAADDASPLWLPTVRTYRQPRPGDWRAALRQAGGALARIIRQGPGETEAECG